MSNKNEGTSEDVTPRAESTPPPHPLASALAARISSATTVRVLLLGIGNGRNVPPFAAADIHVECVEADPTRARAALPLASGARIVVAPYRDLPAFATAFDGALSTNALLHGRASDVGRAVASVRTRLLPGAPFFATFGSTNDPRFGRGTCIDDATFAPTSGPESGVPHAYFDESRVRALFAGFTVESVVETAAAETVGAWAHAPDEAATIVHWFVRARRSAEATQ